jgi:tetratricopeptide (TPR) repeat protein
MDPWDVFRRIVVVAALLAQAHAARAASPLPQTTVAPVKPAATEEPQQKSSFDELASGAATARDAGRLEEALALYRRALSVRSDWPEGRWYIATLLYELDRHAEARDAFAEVLSREPSHAGALGLKGLCEFELRDYERALSDLLQATTKGVSRSPEIARVVRYHAAILLTRFGEFEVAYQMLTGFAAEADETPQVIEAFGVNLLRMPMLPADVPAAQRDTVLLAGRAGYAMAARRSPDARPLLDDLVMRHPTLPHAHYARGVFFLTEDPRRALEDFRRELEISPSHVPARLQIAFELIKRGDAAQARGPAQEAAALAPDHFATRLALGQVMLEMNEIDPAITELEAAAKLAPGSPQAQFMLGRAYARAGRTADAERARAEFTRLDHGVRASREGAQAVGGIPTAGSGVDRPR